MRKILRGHLFTKNILFTLGLGLCFLGEAHAQVSGTFTINSTLPASAFNFQTFSAAVAFVSSGGINGPVTFNVTGGTTYNEQVIINAIPGTSAANTITFNCNGVTLSFLSTDYYQRAGIKLDGADYVTFDNLNVTPQADESGEYGYGFHLLNDADNNTIKNCHITNAVDWSNKGDHEGIVINGNPGGSDEEGDSYCDNNLIQNNTITGGSVGITIASMPVFGNTPVFISGNKIIGNTLSNNISYGIQMHYTSGTLIDGNNITGGPDATGNLIGMYLDYYNYSFSIVNNKVHGFHLDNGKAAYGIFIGSESAAGKTCLIANNLFYDFTTSGRVFGINATQSGAPDYATSYLNIYNNTISLDDQTVQGSEAYGMFFDKTTNVNVMNNIVTVTRNSTDANYGIYFMAEPANYASQRNVIYVPNGAATIEAVGTLNNTNYTTISDWRKSTGYDYYSADVNPGYANLAGFNFKPTTQSIDNLAALLNILTDIDGAARNNTNPDVGCYEFISTACSSTITAGNVTISPDSVLCSGPLVTLGLAGYSAGGGQTYKWQTSTTPTGTYTDISGTLGFPYFEVIPSGTKYYRVALTCGTTIQFSQPQRIMVNTTLSAGTYTINSTQPTGGVNFNSFSDVARALKCGFTGSLVFNVASGSGPYNEQLILSNIPTSATKTITFNCNGVTMSYAPRHKDSSAVVKLTATDYVTIDSLNVEVQGSTTYGFGFQLLNDADHNTIKRCKVNLSTTTKDNNLYSGIVITSLNKDPMGFGVDSYCDSNLIANNTITGGHYGISIASKSSIANYSSCIGNNVRNNIIRDSYGFGIFIAGISNSLIDSNDISQPTRTVLPMEFYGIYVYDNNFDVTITKNRIHNLGENVKANTTEFQGIKCEQVNVPNMSAQPVIISNNLIYTFKGKGLQYGLNNVSSRNIKYYHNTISLDDSAAVSTYESIGFGSFGEIAEQVEVKDNIFYIRRSGLGALYGIYVYLPDDKLVTNYNNYYISSAGPNARMGYLNKPYNTLADWQAGTTNDAGSVAIHPVFEDIAAGDYTPTKIALENRGFNVGINTDFHNETRNTTAPDIGAIEYTICRQLATPALTLAEASVNTIKYTWTNITGTSGYRVSRDGINWSIPSSGALGTSHTIVGLNPTDSVKLLVKALGARADCPEYLSQWVGAQAQSDKVFIPNMFSPNNNQVDDYFKVYSTVMKTMHLMVFNQWGVKVFETSDPQGQWDGNFKGKPQPVGVYVYVVTGALFDGTKVNQKGTFNLIR